MTMAFGETIGGVSHLSRSWRRRLLREPVTKHIDKFAARGIAVSPVADADGIPRACSICGFAIARLELVDGWLAETCSAVGLGTLIGNRHFGPWESRLPALTDQVSAGPGSGTDSCGDRLGEADPAVSSTPSLPGKLL